MDFIKRVLVCMIIRTDVQANMSKGILGSWQPGCKSCARVHAVTIHFSTGLPETHGSDQAKSCFATKQVAKAASWQLGILSTISTGTYRCELAALQLKHDLVLFLQQSRGQPLQ